MRSPTTRRADRGTIARSQPGVSSAGRDVAVEHGDEPLARGRERGQLREELADVGLRAADPARAEAEQADRELHGRSALSSRYAVTICAVRSRLCRCSSLPGGAWRRNASRSSANCRSKSAPLFDDVYQRNAASRSGR